MNKIKINRFGIFRDLKEKKNEVLSQQFYSNWCGIQRKFNITLEVSFEIGLLKKVFLLPI